MEQRQLGTLQVSALGFGCMGLTHSYPPFLETKEAVKLIHEAIDLGCTFLDTAEVYGPFTDEQTVGAAIADRRDQVVLATKFGFDLSSTKRDTHGSSVGLNSKPEHIIQALEGSLKRLRTDHIDLYYQHRVDPEVPIEEVAETMARLIKEGKILHWGLSEASPEIIKRAYAVCPPAAVQSEYSLWYREAEADVLPLCRELKLGFVAFSPLGKGVLALKKGENLQLEAGDFRSDIPRFAQENMAGNLRLVALVQDFAAAHQAAPAQIALSWLLQQDPCIVPIPGTKKSARLKENLGALHLQISTEEWQEFDKKARAIEIKGARYAAAQLKLTTRAQQAAAE